MLCDQQKHNTRRVAHEIVMGCACYPPALVASVKTVGRLDSSCAAAMACVKRPAFLEATAASCNASAAASGRSNACQTALSKAKRGSLSSYFSPAPASQKAWQGQLAWFNAAWASTHFCTRPHHALWVLLFSRCNNCGYKTQSILKQRDQMVETKLVIPIAASLLRHRCCSSGTPRSG